VAVKIRLKRLGTIKRPYFRIVVIDSQAPRDGKILEEVGIYHPIEVEEKQIRLNEERIRNWLKKGAKTSHTVRRLLNKKQIYIK
jgi:small subunit ribosomal protein S16